MTNKLMTAALVVSATMMPAVSISAQRDAEARVLNYIREHLQPGQPLLVSELYSKVFTQPDERKALDKLYNAFFRIPLFVAEYQGKFGSPPRLEDIAQQFDLKSPGAADVLLRVMESDPRVPRFLARDPRTGEVTRVDVEAIQGDPHFGQVIERQLSGWEGRLAPDFTFSDLEEQPVTSTGLRGKVVLLEVWFTGCPPCLRETPELVKLQGEFTGRGLRVVAANADSFLGLGYDDAVRRRYVKAENINFPVVHWTRESDAAFGHIAIFPTLFLMDSKSNVLHHWIGFVSGDELKQAIEEAVNGKGSRP